MIKATLSMRNNKSIQDLKDINAVLHTVGVNLESFAIPEKVRFILSASKSSPINAEHYKIILDQFTLDRPALLAQVAQANRLPAIADGGSLATGEKGMDPYPKIYDLISMSNEIRSFVQQKFGKLHINCTDDRTGVDEFMSVLSGESWIWFFRLKDNSIAKLTLELGDEFTQGWRLCYPGLTPHGAYVKEAGLCVAQIIGPEEWATRYQWDDIEGADLLNTNPWIDFTRLPPILVK